MLLQTTPIEGGKKRNKKKDLFVASEEAREEECNSPAAPQP
jgi:hypothetical protein